MIPTALFFWLAAMNLIACVLMGIDKQRARRGRWRIPEKVLFLSALLGGSVGGLLGMLLFHHKTRHLRFALGLPAILAVQLAAAYFLFF